MKPFWVTSIHLIAAYFYKIHLNVMLQSHSWPYEWIFYVSFPHRISVCLPSRPPCTYISAHSNVLHITPLTKPADLYKSHSSSLCNTHPAHRYLLHFTPLTQVAKDHTISSYIITYIPDLLHLNIFMTILCSNICHSCSSLQAVLHIHTKEVANYCYKYHKC
jgi:hypothetical protein